MQARYHVVIPAQDRIGNRLHARLPAAAHQWLSGTQPRLFKQVWIEGPHQHSFGPAHHLIAIGEDNPETDSYVKQLATHVGQLANHPTISAAKHGKKGIEHWDIPNKDYIEGGPAAPDVIDTSIPF